MSGGYAVVGVQGVLIAVVCLVAEQGLWGAWASATVAEARLPHSTWESFRIRDRTGVPCFARQILNHCKTREAPNLLRYFKYTT